MSKNETLSDAMSAKNDEFYTQHTDNSTVAYTHTPDGKPLRTTYASGRWRENAYNAKRELVSTEYSDGEVCAFAYDEFSHEIAASNSVAAIRLARNDYGQATNETSTVGGESVSIKREFDAFGRLISNDGSAYAYNSAGQLASISNSIAVVEYQYSADGLDAGYSIALSNGVMFTRSVARDGYRRSLVTNIVNSAAGTTVESLAYTYDALNRPICRNTDTFGYNDRSEVTVANIYGVPAAYDYDEIGNSTNWTANSLNQYTQFSYDLDGNLLSDGIRAFSYAAANRLKTVSTDCILISTNFYDAKSRRVKKVTPEATSTFFYDEWNLIEERIAYTNGTSSTIHYCWGDDLSGTLHGAGGVGGLLYLTVDGAVYVPLYDNLGNVTRYLDENGNTVAQYTYDAFGKFISQTGSLADLFRHRFSTKYYDVETALYYYGYRFYHPALMRWLNRDPIEEGGGENLYAFCQNNAIFYYDPNGESFEDVSNFCAGAGDSLIFGLTRLFRRGLNRMIEGTWDDPADVESSAYYAGEYTEIAVEIAVSCGGATLRHVARHSSRQMLEKGARNAYRNAHNISGGVVHHINPIKGHPPVKGMKGGKIARYPLPFEWAARGEWNLTWYATAAEHNAAHRWMMQLESLDKFREITLGTRQLGNRIINKLNSSSDTKCWDSIDLNVYFYNSIDSGANINGIPESVSISIEQYGRQ